MNWISRSTMWVSMILVAVLSVQMFIALDQALPDGMVSSF
jgi:hypothetical protein